MESKSKKIIFHVNDGKRYEFDMKDNIDPMEIPQIDDCEILKMSFEYDEDKNLVIDSEGNYNIKVDIGLMNLMKYFIFYDMYDGYKPFIKQILHHVILKKDTDVEKLNSEIIEKWRMYINILVTAYKISVHDLPNNNLTEMCLTMMRLICHILENTNILLGEFLRVLIDEVNKNYSKEIIINNEILIEEFPNKNLVIRDFLVNFPSNVFRFLIGQYHVKCGIFQLLTGNLKKCHILYYNERKVRHCKIDFFSGFNPIDMYRECVLNEISFFRKYEVYDNETLDFDHFIMSKLFHGDRDLVKEDYMYLLSIINGVIPKSNQSEGFHGTMIKQLIKLLSTPPSENAFDYDDFVFVECYKNICKLKITILNIRTIFTGDIGIDKALFFFYIYPTIERFVRIIKIRSGRIEESDMKIILNGNSLFLSMDIGLNSDYHVFLYSE